MNLVVGNDARAVNEVLIIFAFQRQHETPIDFLNDLQNPRYFLLHHVNVPAFHRLSHNRMVGVAHDVDRNLPGILPAQAMLIHQKPHQFGDCHGWMRVVDVNSNVLIKLGQRLIVFFQIVIENALQTGRNEEVFLTDPHAPAIFR